jgi:MAP3K TRAFs-binding domain
MNSCYVAIPFGVKSGATGRMIDFDAIFAEVIRPAVEESGLECLRLQDMPAGVVLQKALFSAILGSDLMIADVSLHNANVMYELGIRHAVRRGRTLIIMAAGDPVPSNIGYSRVLTYAPDGQGRLTGPEAEQFSALLRATIHESRERLISDSPLYEFFPDLQVELPAEVAVEFRRRPYPRITKRAAMRPEFLQSHAETVKEIAQAEEQVRAVPDADPYAYLDLLRRYRDLSDWDQLIRLAAEAPPEVRRAPEAVRLHALALNRRRQTGDQEHAIAILEQLIAETGGDSESFGLLGLIHKDRYESRKADGIIGPAARQSLDQAINAYRAGFLKDPVDYYAGLNAVTLILQRDAEGDRNEVTEILPRVRASVEHKIASGSAGFWEHVARMQLAAASRDWEAAEDAARTARSYASQSWLLKAARRDLAALAPSMQHSADGRRLRAIEKMLTGDGEAEGGYHA